MQRSNTVTMVSIDGEDTLSLSLSPEGALSFDPDNAGAEFGVEAVRETLAFLERLRELSCPSVGSDG